MCSFHCFGFRFRDLTKHLETGEEHFGSLQEAHAFRSDVAETKDWIVDKVILRSLVVLLDWLFS